MPSRWSISCWTARATRPVALPAVGLPLPVRGLEHDPDGPGDLGVELRESRGILLRPQSRPSASTITGSTMHEPVLFHVHHRDPAGHADLVGGEPDALGGVHGLEQVVHELLRSVVDLGDLLASAAEHGGAEQVDVAAVPSAWPPGAASFADLDDAAPPDDQGGAAALDRDPRLLDVLHLAHDAAAGHTSSPFFRLASSSSCFFRALHCGRMMRK